MAAWCAARDLSVRSPVSLDQLWHLARTWYADRLTVESRRPKAEEISGIFAAVGLVGEFWDLTADR